MGLGVPRSTSRSPWPVLLFAVALVPDSKNPSAQRPDLVGSLLSIAGLGLLLYAIIEAPVHGWASALVVGAGIGGLGVLGAFVTWERASAHPMLNLGFFRNRSFSAPIVSVGLTMFGLFGSLFVLTQFLQFQLGYSPLQAGVRMLPAAGAIAVVAPLSEHAGAQVGPKLTIAAGLLVVTAGLWQISTATSSTAYGGIVAGMALLGIGAGLVIPAVTGVGDGLAAAPSTPASAAPPTARSSRPAGPRRRRGRQPALQPLRRPLEKCPRPLPPPVPPGPSRPGHDRLRARLPGTSAA